MGATCVTRPPLLEKQLKLIKRLPLLFLPVENAQFQQLNSRLVKPLFSTWGRTPTSEPLLTPAKETSNGRETSLQKHLQTLSPLLPRTLLLIWARSSMTFIRLLMSCSAICHKATTRREPNIGLHPKQ